MLLPDTNIRRDYVVRAGAAADVPRILPMVASLIEQHKQWDAARYSPLPDVLDRYARWFPARASEGLLAVAQDTNGGLIGFAVASIEQEVPIYVVKEYGFIHDCYVEPRNRGNGVGQKLVEHLLHRFEVLAVAQVRLDTAKANDGARRLFSKLGFRESVIQMLRE